MDIEEAIKLAEAAVLAKAGRHLGEPEVTILRGTWQGMTYDQMAQTSQYSVNYLMRDIGPKFWKLLSEALGEEVSKTNLRSLLQRREAAKSGIPEERSEQVRRQSEPGLSESVKQEYAQPSELIEGGRAFFQTYPRHDWGEAPDISIFYGRTEELATLQQWIVNDGCRVVALLGLSGIGKTTLSVKLAKQIQDEFEYIIWRSLRQAPSINDLLVNLLQFLSLPSSTAENIEALLSQLIEALRTSRCLLVLDNVETILQSGELAGQYREGYKGYTELLRRVGEESHQSCLVLTSLEKPREIAQLAGNTLPVRSLTLTGLQETDARKILKAKGLSGEEQWNILIKLYRGNPLALKLVATTIEELFNGQVAEFIRRKMLVFGDLHDLLDQPFNRLSDLEKEIMYWLAIEQQPCTIRTLQDDFWLPVSERDLFEALTSLGRRCLSETSTEGGESLFTLQPVVMEYVINQLIEQVSDEICQLLKSKKIEQTKLFRSLTLIKIPVRDNSSSQALRLLTAVVDSLRTIVRSETKIIQPLSEILGTLSEKSQLEVGYASDNILYLLHELNPSSVQDYELLHQPLVPRAPES